MNGKVSRKEPQNWKLSKNFKKLCKLEVSSPDTIIKKEKTILHKFKLENNAITVFARTTQKMAEIRLRVSNLKNHYF